MILNRQRRIPIALAPLEVFARRVASTLRVGRESFSVCLVSDAEMARMNRRFRATRGPTDVLSFPTNGVGRALALGSGARSEFLGDIAISPQSARRNAQRDGRALSRELQILILHGVLHLMGYDHEADEGEMERLELRLRQRLGISRERSRPTL